MSSPTHRIVALDVLRGFALCGILLANVKPIAHRGAPLGAGVAGSSTEADVLHMFVDQRFFPIFSLLFGVGFALLMRKSDSRTPLARRLAALLAIGLVHLLTLWRGDILTVYAAVGLIVLLPSTWLPRRVVAVLGAVLVLLSLALLGGWYSLIPGLFLVGSALTRYGLVDRIEELSWKPAVLFAAAALPVAVVQWRAAGEAFRIAYPTAGLLLAGAYVCGLVALLRTGLRRPLIAVFAPLGRMALTNYLSATILVLAVATAAGGSDSWPASTVVLIAATVLMVQWLWSTLWLRHFRQGPLEWLWRWATWLHRPPLRRPTPATSHPSTQPPPGTPPAASSGSPRSAWPPRPHLRAADRAAAAGQPPTDGTTGGSPAPG